MLAECESTLVRANRGEHRGCGGVGGCTSMRVVSYTSDSLCVFVYEEVRRRGLGGR